MKSVRSFLPLVLVGALVAPAAAKSAVPSPQASAVAIMRDSGQALLWDTARGEYLLVKAGDHFQGFFVVTISDAAVVLAVASDPEVRHVLELAPAPTRRPRARPGEASRARPTVITLAHADAGGAALDVIDPYPSDSLEVVDPYGGPPGATPKTVAPTVVFAGELPSAGARPSVREVRAPGNTAVETPSEPVAGSPQKPPKPAHIGVKPLPPVPVRRTVQVVRADLDTALSDFDALAREVQVEGVKGGGVRVVGIARGSFFHRTGIRNRDVIRAVAGERLTNIESAALVYARIQATDEFDIEIDRGKQRVILTYALE